MLEVRTAREGFERGVLARDSAQGVIDEVVREPWFPLAFVPPILPPAPGRWPTMDFDPEYGREPSVTSRFVEAVYRSLEKKK